MKFPVPETLTGAVLPMMLINWVFGIGIIQYPLGRPRPIISAFWSITNFLIYLGLLRMANFQEVIRIGGSKIAANNYYINAYLCAAFIAISMCLAQAMTKIVESIFSKLSDINDRLKILGIHNDYKMTFKSQIIKLTLAFVCIFIIMVLDFKYIGSTFPTETSRIGFLMAYHYCLVFLFVIDSTFSGGIRYFCNRFQRLNALLEQLDSLERTETTLIRVSNNKVPHYSSVIRRIYRNNFQAIEATDKHWLLCVVTESRQIHLDLCKTAMKLNRAFGIQVLLSVALSFGLITMLCYSTYVLVIPSTSRSSELDDWIVKIIVITWIMFYVVKLLLIVDACSTAACEANRTGELIIRLQNTTACDENIRDEISIFSLQLLQNPLNFTASGFFTLNYGLVRGIMKSVTTYLVIMIQMRSIYDPKEISPTTHAAMMVQINSTDGQDLVKLETYTDV